MRGKIFFTLLTFLTFVYSTQGWGMQRFSVSDGDVLSIKMSSRELTRLTVEGGRIEKLWGTQGALETQVDKKDGEVFLRPKMVLGSTNVISFFVRDNFGSTYTLMAEMVDLPSQTVVLSPKRRTLPAEKEKFKNRPLVKEIKDLLRAMVLGDPLHHYEEGEGGGNGKVVLDSKIPLWKEIKFTPVKNYRGAKITGEVYRLKNISDGEIKIKEEEFVIVYPDVLGVAVENLSLKKDEDTLIYLIRKR